MRELLKMKFCEGVTVDLACRAANLKTANGWSERDRQDRKLQAVYAHETGRDATPRFTGGLGRAQWDYAIRATDYYTKDARAAVVALSSR